ncbi:MAG: cobalt ECF transporter T component CbiQ [Anaerolineae bacterium]|nr:cobalt ECF transporter T component CbiQ [Anaerolineae bacterium]
MPHRLEPYREGNSPIHSLDSRVRVVMVLVFILVCALVPVGAWAVYILLLALILSAELLTDLGIAYFIKRSLMVLPFVLAALPLVFSTPHGIQFNPAGLERFISIALKSWISVQAAILLAVTTPFDQLLLALRALHLPRLLVAVIGLMWRYLFVMVDEVTHMMLARAARSGSDNPARRTGGTVVWRARVTGGMAGGLLLRSLDHSDRVYHAMLSRGYDGEVRTLPQPSLTTANRWLLAGFILFAIFLVALSILFWG